MMLVMIVRTLRVLMALLVIVLKKLSILLILPTLQVSFKRASPLAPTTLLGAALAAAIRALLEPEP
jgi:hypothetical protein